MTIIRCDRRHDASWNAFVQAHPQASFYHRAEWRDVNTRSFGHRTCYLAAVEGDRVAGVFPLVQLRSVMFGNIACSLPFVNYGGPAAESEAIEGALLDAAAAVAGEWRVDYLEIRSRRHLGDRYPSSAHKVSMTVDLDLDPDNVWNAYKAKVGPRQDIRRGYKNGFTARFGGIELVAAFYEVLAESWRDLGTPIYRKAYLEAVLETFPLETRICVVSAADGTPAAAALCGHHRDVVEGMWLGTRARFRKEMAGYVLYWELIKDACERGYARFHLGRSTAQSGGEQFKKKWNAQAVQLYWQYMLRGRDEVPALNVANPRYRLAIKAWQNLPVPVTRMIGPLIARSIP
ncbi:MAG: FemAB family XrtA/PEP-CTERM system-associated protein [Vicinamibacterales bacterium]